MENYLKIAEDHILTNVGDDCGLVTENFTDYGDVICFYYQSKKYLETKNFIDMYVGQGPEFIVKTDNRIVPYGSAWDEEKAIENLRRFLNIESEIRLEYPLFDCFSTHFNFTLENESNEESLTYIRKELNKQPF